MMLSSVYVYKKEFRLETLYELLAERTPAQSISHVEMPTFTQHERFVESRPYVDWWFICSKKNHSDVVGAIYLTHSWEIGIAVFSAYRQQGIGSRALDELFRIRRGKFLANINPGNRDSIEFFEKHGFRHVQNTYVREA